jgi:hypothetical protein
VRPIPLICVALLSAASPAWALEALVFPSRPLVADGTRVHVVRVYFTEGELLLTGVPQVRATHGAVIGSPIPATDGGVSLRYRPPKVSAPSSDTLSFTLGDRQVAANVALEPAGRVQLSAQVSPDPIVLGAGAEATLKVKVTDPAGRPVRAALRLGASIGKVLAVREVTVGEYQATYIPPDDKFPQVAILAAHSLLDGAFAVVPLKLAARVVVAGEGEPGGTMLITVDGKSYGPQPIGTDGKFSIKVVVPPGARVSGQSTDALGNQRARAVDLGLPPFPRNLLAVVPPELPADGKSRAEVLAFSVDARGNPERGRAPPLSVERGTLSAPTPRGDGAWSWSYTVPGSLGAGTVTFKSGAASTRMILRFCPPFHIDIDPPRDPLGAGGGEQRFDVRLSDATASPVTGARLSATLAGGRVLSIDEKGGGVYSVRAIPPKDPGRGAAAVHVELAALAPGAPRRVTLHPMPPSGNRFVAEVWVDDDLGLPVPGVTVDLTTPEGTRRATTDKYGTARIQTSRPARGALHLSAQALELPGVVATIDALFIGGTPHVIASQAGRGVIDQNAAPPGATADAELPLAPSTPIDLRLILEAHEVAPGKSLRVRVARNTTGTLLSASSAGKLELVRLAGDGGMPELRFSAPADSKPGSKITLSVTDAASRVTVFTEVTIK